MMKQYDSYKDSGVEWIGKIPSHWNCVRLKFYCAPLKSGGTPKSDDQRFYSSEGTPWVAISDMSSTTFIYDTEKHLTKEGIEDKRLVIYPVGTLLYSIYATLGKVSELKVPACINQAILAISPKSEYDKVYFRYCLQTQEQFVFSLSNGNTQNNLNADKVANFNIVLPPLSDQQKIVSYLDNKCGEIDKAIATQEKRVELFKELRQNIITQAVTRGINPDAPLKDSGVEWIGDIPEHWKVMKMNHALRSIADVNHYMPDSVSEGYPYIMTGDLKEYLSEIDLDSCKQISEKDYKELIVKCKAQKGDVIFARYATIGTVCYVDVDKEFVVSYSCVTIKPNSSILDGLFLFYYLQTHTFFEDISQSINSNTQGNVGIESLSASRLIVPPLSEQQEIVSYIESQTARLDKSIEKAEHQIELLQELKQSIITEVVTGKRKVV